MLVTLLLCNAGALETLPIYLSKAVSEFVAIMFAVIGVLLVGEIIPQSICTGPNQLAIAKMCCPIVLGLMYVTAPITWPIAKWLDCWLGEHKITRFTNAQLRDILELHRSRALKLCHEELPAGADGLNDTQVDMMTGAMTLGEHSIHDIYTPIAQVQRIYLDTKFNTETTQKIMETGFSRIPVAFSEEHPVIVGILLVKTCLAIEPSNDVTIAELYIKGDLSLKVPPYLS